MHISIIRASVSNLTVNPSILRQGSPERSRRAQDERIYSYNALIKVYIHSILHRA
jgi:hypothetical protein